MDNMTLDEYLDKFREERAQFLDGVFSSLAETDDYLNELEKYGKLLERAQKSNNYGPVRRYAGTQRFKAFFGSTLEQSQNDASKVCGSVSVNVKKEKLSINSGSSLQSLAEDCDSMPAPKMPAPKKKRVKKEKVSIGSIVKTEPDDDSDIAEKRVTRSTVVNRTSDVIIHNPVIPVIELDDSLDKTEELPIRSSRTRTVQKGENGPSRSTRTNAKKKVEEKENEKNSEVTSRTTRTKTKQKRDVSTSDNIAIELKTSNSHEVPPNISSHTEYEDAASHLENRIDATFVVPKESIPNGNIASTDLNRTVVIEKKKINPFSNNGDDMLTDDESLDAETISTKQKPKQGADQVFSPYENSPVKKKVEAFEKLQKKECAASNSKLHTSRILKEIENNKGNVKEKAKSFIGKHNGSSASKIGKYIGQTSSMLNNNKLANELRDRELRRQEREQELRKNEISKQTMSVERKKKYDEKIKKLQQQQKDALEKEKEKALELQRIKDERYKKVLQQKEDRQKQLKEENERRRLLAKQRAEEKRKEEEALRTGPQNKKQRNENDKNIAVPIYLVQPTPPLPCDDCYDSDDERFNQTRKIPSWSSKSQVMKQDHLQTSLGHKIKNTLFSCQSQNIDLRDVFQRIDPRKLKRTSSANWGKPPRFTLLPSTIE